MRRLKGWFGEKKTAFIMWLFLNGKSYHRFHNLIIPSKKGSSQIDHLIVSRQGFFIVETKNLKAWVFGSEHSKYWTQTLFNRKYQFQNPLKQCYRQKKILAEFLDIEESLINVVVYFVGESSFKTALPENVIDKGLIRYIRKFQHQVLSDTELEETVMLLKVLKSESLISRKDHLLSLKQRHGSKSICPNCGSNLVIRKAKNGPRTGFEFLGCSSFPKCKFSRNI
ncbi:MAG: NERD domain-containing protein [Bacteroidetes bacterium]|nr:NERD domain-containing protein [Bacteroidota bacterium]